MLRATSIALVLVMLATAAGAAALGDEPVGANGPPTSIVPQPPNQTPPTKFETFEDGEGRITLIPYDGGDNCRAEAPVRLGQDLRSVIFLDPDGDCSGPGRRRIETYAGLDGNIDLAIPEPCVAPPAVCAALAGSLRLPKQRYRTVARSDGWIDVIVVTKGDPALAATPLRYTIVLHTTQSHLTVDLRAFATTLNAVTAP